MSDQAEVTQPGERGNGGSDDNCVDAIATIAAVTIIVVAFVFWLTTL